jgi:hypothetical protein
LRIVQYSAPSVEPISLAEAKTQCRIETAFTDDDTYLALLISAARRYCEGYCHQGFVNQTWDLYLDNWTQSSQLAGVNFFGASPSAAGNTYFNNSYRLNRIDLPHGPVSAVTWVKYTDQGGTQQTWDSANYVTSLGLTARVSLKAGQTFPVVASQADVITVRYVVGYGADGTQVPHPARAAILLMVAHLYQNRLAVDDVSLTEIPMGVKALLDSISDSKRMFA